MSYKTFLSGENFCYNRNNVGKMSAGVPCHMQ